VIVTANDGFELDVQVRGSGRDLLLLQGQANSDRWWRGLRERFEDRHRTITLDWRGTGGSRGVVGDWSTSLLASDAVAVLDALEVDSARVYGTSMGGRVAQVLAIDAPDRVAALALACTSPGGTHAHERSADVRRRLADPDASRRRAALHDLFFTPAYPPDLGGQLFGDPTMSREESRAHLRISARHDAWDRLPQITAPTLVLHGTDDLMAPVLNAHLIAERIPGAEVALWDGGRHGFFLEWADEVSARVGDFLAAAPG
jgi:pimeloyl-ACP methyl ester carboxylesterase